MFLLTQKNIKYQFFASYNYLWDKLISCDDFCYLAKQNFRKFCLSNYCRKIQCFNTGCGQYLRHNLSSGL